MSNSFTTQQHKGTFLTAFTVFIGLLLGGTAEAGFGEPGTAWNPTTATQALEWIEYNPGQCPLFPDEWRRGSTLDLEIPEIKVKIGRGGVAMKIDDRHYKGKNRAEFWAATRDTLLFGSDKKTPNLTHVFEYCQKIYGINKTKAWREQIEISQNTHYMPMFFAITFTGIATGLTSDNVHYDGSVVAGIAGAGTLISLGAKWVGKRVASKQLKNSEIPNLIRQLFVEAQAQEQEAKDLAIQCVKNFDQLTPESDSAALRKREKDCKKAIDSYAPQTHAWQTERVLNRLKKNALTINNLVSDHQTLALSSSCDRVGKTSRTKLRSYDALTLSNNLSVCKSLAELLKEAKGSDLDTHYQTLGVLSASRVQTIIKSIIKADEWQKKRARKAEKEKKKKAAKAGMQFLRGIILSNCASTKKTHRSWGGENSYCKARASEYRGQISQRNEYNKCKSGIRRLRAECKKARAPGW